MKKQKLKLVDLTVESFITTTEQTKIIAGGKPEDVNLLDASGLTQCNIPGGCLAASNPLVCIPTYFSCNDYDTRCGWKTRSENC